MFEEKWWKPKTVEQLVKEEKDRQFRKWIEDKCKDIVKYASKSTCDYDRYKEDSGYMWIECYTKANFESCRFFECYKVPIDDFWDKDNPIDMAIEKT